MKLSFQKGQWLSKLKFFKKLLFGHNSPNWPKFGPKIENFDFFSGTIHMIFLIICMKLSFQKGQWLSKLKFFKKFLLGQNSPNWPKFGPKIKNFAFFSGKIRRIFLIFCMKLSSHQGQWLRKPKFFKKFLFGLNSPNCPKFGLKSKILPFSQEGFVGFSWYFAWS